MRILVEADMIDKAYVTLDHSETSLWINRSTVLS